MTQTKNFVIFARAWTSSPPPIKTPAAAMETQSSAKTRHIPVDVSSTSSRSGTETPSSTVSTATTSSTIESVTSDKPIPRRRGLDFSALENIFENEESSAENSESSPLWYILTTAVLLALHKEKLIGDLWRYLSDCSEADEGQLLSIARRIRESCLKASTLVGFPRAINALLSLKSAIESSQPAIARTLSLDTSLRDPVPAPEKQARGMAFFQQIYRQHTPRVLAAMDDTSGGDLTHFALTCIYGELLAEHRIVGGLETGLLEFVCCLADGCGPQAKGHFFGSVNLGASHETLRAAVALTEETARQVGVACLWKDADEHDDFRFLEKVMR